MIGQVFSVSFDNSGFSDSGLLAEICLAGIYWIWCLGGGVLGRVPLGLWVGIYWVGWVDLVCWSQVCLVRFSGLGLLGQVF